MSESEYDRAWREELVSQSSFLDRTSRKTLDCEKCREWNKYRLNSTGTCVKPCAEFDDAPRRCEQLGVMSEIVRFEDSQNIITYWCDRCICRSNCKHP